MQNKKIAREKAFGEKCLRLWSFALFMIFGKRRTNCGSAGLITKKVKDSNNIELVRANIRFLNIFLQGLTFFILQYIRRDLYTKRPINVPIV